jgi:DNA-binding Lrp family transcriptional regulator
MNSSIDAAILANFRAHRTTSQIARTLGLAERVVADRLRELLERCPAERRRIARRALRLVERRMGVKATKVA